MNALLLAIKLEAQTQYIVAPYRQRDSGPSLTEHTRTVRQYVAALHAYRPG